MKKLLTLFAATAIGLFQSHAAEVTPVLSPAPTDADVTNLATIKITFEGLEMLTTPRLAEVNATLTNTTTSTKYVCVGVKTGSWKAPNEVTLSFGLEGTTESLGEIKEDGTYKLSIAANSFKSEIVDPTYYSPLIEATYTIGGDIKDSMSDYTLTPGAGNVTEISSIKVDFPGTGFMGISIVSLDGITLTYSNPSGTVTRVAKVVKNEYNMGSFCTLMFNWEDSELKEPLTFIEPGTYTLDIPAGAFSEFYATPKNRHISATYTIVANGGAMSTCQITPAAGNVDKIETVKLNFGGNEVSSMEFADDLSDITIVRRGEFTGEWYCLNAYADGRSGVALNFARKGTDTPAVIDVPGEFLLTIPANKISGYTAGGRKWNDGIQVIYNIATGADHMGQYTITPDSKEVLKELQNIVITFPDAYDGIAYPVETENIAVAFIPEKGDAVTDTYHPNGMSIDGSAVTLVFNQPFTTNGSYRLTIPQGCMKEYGNADASFNPAIETTFIIGNGTSSLDTIEDASGCLDVASLLNDALYPVYNLQGMMVRSAGDNTPLPAGMYIITGHKIAIK